MAALGRILEVAAVIGVPFFFPMLPAMVVYRKLDSSTMVKGPFKGLDVRLTGAFGAYFLLLLVAVPLTVMIWRQQRADLHDGTYSAWTVQGIVDPPGTVPVETASLTVDPPIQAVRADGRFYYVIPVQNNMPAGVLSLRLSLPSFTPATVTLGKDPLLGIDNDVVVDTGTHTITIRQPIKLAAAQVYDPSRPAYATPTPR